jgi:hypothetical protein
VELQEILTFLREAEARTGQWMVKILDRLERLEQDVEGLRTAPPLATAPLPIAPKRAPATHCRYGHSLEDAYVSYGKRYCRPCAKQRARENYAAAKVLHDMFGEAYEGGTSHAY